MNWLTALLLPFVLTTGPAGTDDVVVRLATFNIHHAEGRDGKLDLDRVVQVVRDADVIAFQEVDVRFSARSRFIDQATELAKSLHGEVVFGGNLIKGDGQYGVALVSKFPILSSRNLRLPHSAGREKAEPRGLLEVTLDVKGGPVRVFVTHLAHDSTSDRTLQVDAVRKAVAEAKGRSILMGDLNLRPTSESYQRLLQGEGEGADKLPLLVDAWTKVGRGDGATIGLEGRNPGRIDYIMVSPDLAAGLETIHVETETIASDHQPVFATLRLSAKR